MIYNGRELLRHSCLREYAPLYGIAQGGIITITPESSVTSSSVPSMLILDVFGER